MPHREETFAILAVNAWELLLKARLLMDGGNKVQSIQALVPIRNKAGQVGKRFRVERNGAGNAKTISLGEAVRRLSEVKEGRLDPACAGNIRSMVEIRDNAVHFMNTDAAVGHRVFEIGCGFLRNYVALVAEWFDQDLSEHRFMILPLSFEGGTKTTVLPSRRSKQATRLLAFLDQTATESPARDADRFAVAIQIETRIVGSRAKDAIAVRLGGGPDAPAMRLSEDELRENWPLDYAALCSKVKERQPSIKINKHFNDAMRVVKSNPRLMHSRHLDPANAKSAKKEFFAPGAVDALLKVLEREGR